MAQTVAMQRGAISGTANGGWITVFTQSSGIAARVIPVNFEQYFSQSPNNNNGAFQLAIVSSAGGGQIISSIGNVGSSSFANFQITCTTNNAQDLIGLVGNAYQKSIGWRGSGTSTPYNAGVTSVNAYYGAGATSNANAIGQFFMGNGDSLRYRITATFNSGKSQPNCTTNVSYSFVTVTES
jgi:hypothetical protein